MKKFLKKVKNKYIVITLLLIISIILYLFFLNKKVIPLVINYADVQLKKIGLEVLRNCKTSELNDYLKDKNFYSIIKNNAGEIESIDIDTTVLNEAMLIVNSGVRKRLDEIENGNYEINNIKAKKISNNIRNNFVYLIPTGVVSNILFANLGPKIPIKIQYLGSVGSDIKTSVKEYGINSSLIEVYVYVEVTQRIVYPFKTKDTKLVSKIPILLKVVKGNVPNGITNYSLSK